jgi:hypothetical protein
MKKDESSFVRIIQVNSRGKEVVSWLPTEVAESQSIHLADEIEPPVLILGGLLDALFAKTRK